MLIERFPVLREDALIVGANRLLARRSRRIDHDAFREKEPNGWISHDLLVWNELDRRGFVASGFALDVPDLRHAMGGHRAQ
jgi:hypothetical protein